MRIRIDLKIFLMVLIFYFTKQVEIFSIILLFVFIHELSHMIVGIILGLKIDKVEINPCGFSIVFKTSNIDYNKRIKKASIIEIKKMIIALAGPLVNLLIIILVLNLKISIITQIIIVYSNLVIILFNLMPIYPLDGGRILKAICIIFFGRTKGRKIVHNLSFVTLILITLLSSFMIYYFKNISIFFAVIYLWYIFIIEGRKYQNLKKLYNLLENK